METGCLLYYPNEQFQLLLRVYLSSPPSIAPRSLTTNISFAIFGVAFVMGIIVFGIFQTQLKSSLTEAQLNNVGREASSLAQLVNAKLEAAAQRALSIRNTPSLHSFLKQSNQYFTDKTESQRNQEISHLNQLWRSAEPSLIRERLSNDTALYLKSLVLDFPQYYGEIFLTNRYGAMIASSAKLTTLAHAHKYWWQAAYNQGKGAIFIDDRGFDESVGDYVVGIVVPIWEGSEFVGILKANVKITGSLNAIVNGHNATADSEAYLAREKGLIIAKDNTVPLSESLSLPLQSQVDAMTSKLQSLMTFADASNFTGVARISLSLQNVAYPVIIGGKNITQDKDAKLGNEGEGWVAIVNLPNDIALTGYYQSLRYGSILLILFVAASGLLATFAARTIAKNEKDKRLKLFQANEKLKVSNRQLVEANELAESVSIAKSTFIANMSHEIRTPMNGVLGLIGVLLNTKLDSNQRDLLQKVANSGKTLLGVINDILDYSKIESNKLELERASVNVRALAEESFTLFDTTATQKGLTLQLDIDDDLAPYYIADPLRLGQIINNLLGNAIKYTIEGGIILSIYATPRNKHNHEILITISDTGIGIPEQDKEKIFSAFEQVNASDSRRFGGTGLGLKICQRLVTLMGGRIWLTSEFGLGSKFFVSLPLDIDTEAITSNINGDTEARVLKSSFTAKALIAEDNEINQIVACEVLKSYGLTVEVANNGKEAVKMAQSGQYNIIFMDLKMPELDGFSAARAIRQYDQQTPIIALSAAVLSEDVRLSIQAGMNAHLAKPMEREALENVLHKFLADRTSQAAC